MIWRIGLFYVGSVVLLVMLLPWSAYQAGQSPFVTFFSKLGVPYIGSIMNIVVLTAALSSLNSGLYCTVVFCARWRWAVPHRSLWRKRKSSACAVCRDSGDTGCVCRRRSLRIWCRRAYLRLC
ncbi:hypothetical protein ACLB1E_22925 [Escherichia coli]